MKKTLFAGLLIFAAAAMAGCGNYEFIDTTYEFDRAILSLPNGEILEGEVESWTDYEDDQLQIKIDGVTYLVHSSDAVLIAE